MKFLPPDRETEETPKTVDRVTRQHLTQHIESVLNPKIVFSGQIMLLGCGYIPAPYVQIRKPTTIM